MCFKNDCPGITINSISDIIIKKNTHLSFYMCIMLFRYWHGLLYILCYIPNSFSFKQLNILVFYIVFSCLTILNRLYFSGVRSSFKLNSHINICLSLASWDFSIRPDFRNSSLPSDLSAASKISVKQKFQHCKYEVFLWAVVKEV